MSFILFFCLPRLVKCSNRYYISTESFHVYGQCNAIQLTLEKSLQDLVHSSFSTVYFESKNNLLRFPFQKKSIFSKKKNFLFNKIQC